MMSISSFSRVFARLRGDERGFTAVLMGLTFMSMMGFAGMVIDVGNVFVARRMLQSSADAAALSGAAVINGSTAGAALTVANDYSAKAGSRNVTSYRTVTVPSGYPQLKCLTSIGVSCVGTDNANAIVVKQQTRVPTYFASLFNINGITVTATSTASLAAGVTRPLNVMMVVDSTASMQSNDANCAGATKISCALAGGREVMSGISPTASKIGVMVFPPVVSTTAAAKMTTCGQTITSSDVAPYSSGSAVYKVQSLSNNFKTNDNATSLNSSSASVVAFKGGCVNGGITAIGGKGTYYADAITNAQADLTTNGDAGVQKVIILLSDGDAQSSYAPSGKTTNQCQQAVTAANAAKATGTLIYVIAYDSQTSGTCSTDSGGLTACAALRSMASNNSSDPLQSTFYSTDGGTGTCPSAGHTNVGLTSVFGAITQQFRGTRLLPNSTT